MMVRYNSSALDRFEPDANDDPQDQRRLRGLLEKIDYTAFASNREVLGAMVGSVDEAGFQRLAVAASQARARWVAAALKLADDANATTPAAAESLAGLRATYEEFAAAYDALRRMVERGYVKISAPKTMAAASKTGG